VEIAVELSEVVESDVLEELEEKGSIETVGGKFETKRRYFLTTKGEKMG